MSRATILVADDEDTLRENLSEVLKEEGFNVIACNSGDKALRAIKNNGIDAIVTDLRMPGLCGMDLIDRAANLVPNANIIVITAFGDVETAVEAMKKGAKDYICKPLIFDDLIFKLKRLLAQDHLEKQNRILREQIRKTYENEQIVAASQAMRDILDHVRRVSNTRSNVLITGESGTGKELLARALHFGGVTSDMPFVPVNCGGLVDTLVESELFGYRRGAFTGAESDRTGYFEAADGGTLFLDEIGNLPLKSQAVLLRAIEEKAITRVGDHSPRPVSLRIIAATNQDLDAAITTGAFREDLYYRLNVVRIAVPPLRSRPEDIPALIDRFIQKHARDPQNPHPGFSPAALSAAVSYRWPGNVRELENVVERTLIFAEGRPVEPADLPFFAGQQAAAASTLDLRAAQRQFERQHILRVLASVRNNKVAAAEALGIALSSLYRKIEELGIAHPAESAKVE
ncbi:MAG: sigma-54-dependent transcriptional regulator [Phycisphaerae bacterium]